MEGISTTTGVGVGATIASTTTDGAAPAAAVPHIDHGGAGQNFFQPNMPPPDGFAFDPLREILALLQRLLQQLMNSFPPPPPDPILPPPGGPVAAATVQPGDVVGYLSNGAGKTGTMPTAATSRKVSVEDVIGAFDSEDQALAIARRYSERNGEPVAIVQTWVPDHRFLPSPANGARAILDELNTQPGNANPNAPNIGGAKPAPGHYVYNVVTLDPAIAPQYAHRVQSWGQDRIAYLVQGFDVATTGSNPPPPPGPGPGPLPVPHPHLGHEPGPSGAQPAAGLAPT